MSARPRIDLTGQPFSRWTVISFSHRSGSSYLWNCQCSCGTERAVTSSSLKLGTSTSCGCGPNKGCNFRHGQAAHGNETPEYRTWQSMRRRCNDPNNPGFYKYGARGIAVCDRWNNSFEDFFADMGSRPEGTSIDRINNDGNYEPNNCRWATIAVQANNRRDNRFCELDGRRQTVAQWSRELGIGPSLIRQRRGKGWSDRDALLTAPNPKHRGAAKS